MREDMKAKRHPEHKEKPVSATRSLKRMRSPIQNRELEGNRNLRNTRSYEPKPTLEILGRKGKNHVASIVFANNTQTQKKQSLHTALARIQALRMLDPVVHRED